MAKRYVLMRAALVVPVVLGVVTIVFSLIHLIPGDPVEAMLGESAIQAQKEEWREALGLNRPLHLQYLSFLSSLATGNLGVSFRERRPVMDIIAGRFPATLELTLASLAIALLIAIPTGIISALKKGKSLDYGSMFFALLGISIPHFWLGPVLIIVFSLKLNLLPVSGRIGILSLILPALTLGTALAAILARMTRASMLEVLNEDYLRTARAKGLPESVVVLKHALRNALMPVITIVGMQFGALLAGSIITETIFSWPGIGSLTIEAIGARDYPLVQGCILVIALCYVIVNLATDILYGIIDPRIRHG